MQPAPLPRRPVRDRVARFGALHLFRRPVRARNARPIITFTFDDIDETAASAGATVLERHGARGTFYVAGSLCGARGENGRFASLDDCRALAERGHEIGCHTYAHRAMRMLTPAALDADLARNADALAHAVSGHPLENFALPYNAPTLRAKRLLSDRFTTCRGGQAGINQGLPDFAYLKSIEINDDDLSAAAAQGWIDRAVSANGWLIFFTHDIRAKRSRHGCTPRLFEDIVGRAVRSGAEVLTVRDAVRSIRGTDTRRPA